MCFNLHLFQFQIRGTQFQRKEGCHKMKTEQTQNLYSNSKIYYITKLNSSSQLGYFEGIQEKTTISNLIFFRINLCFPKKYPHFLPVFMIKVFRSRRRSRLLVVKEQQQCLQSSSKLLQQILWFYNYLFETCNCNK